MVGVPFDSDRSVFRDRHAKETVNYNLASQCVTVSVFLIGAALFDPLWLQSGRSEVKGQY